MSERRVDVHVTAAADLPNTALKPYLKVTLDGHTVKTKAVSGFGENPLFDEHFTITLPVALPNETQDLHVECKSEVPLLPNITVARGKLRLDSLFVSGSEDAKVVLHDNSGSPAGTAHIHLKMMDRDTAVGSAAGAVISEAVAQPEGGAAAGTASPDVVPTAAGAPPSKVLGAAVPGMVDDPSKPTYGILE